MRDIKRRLELIEGGKMTQEDFRPMEAVLIDIHHRVFKDRAPDLERIRRHAKYLLGKYGQKAAPHPLTVLAQEHAGKLKEITL